jgi:UDP-2-acetamido-2,6-beta-L-arabino-hexul-4-ose reductase
MKKILVTGADGFIGKALCEYLKKSNYNVVRFCRPLDVTEYSDVIVALDDAVDCVVHLAGLNKGDDKKLFVDNVDGVLNFAKACLYRQKRFINISSDYEAKSAYRASKRIGNAIVQEMVDNMNLNAVSLVLPKVIGPGCKPFYNSFASTLLYLLAKNKPYEHLIQNKNAKFTYATLDYAVCSITCMIETNKRGLHYCGHDLTSISFPDIIEKANTDDGNYFSETKKWYSQNM